MKTGIKGIRRVSAVAVIAAGAVLSAGALAPVQAATVATPTITAKGGFVMNNGTGKALYTKAADTRLSTGSTTKIMTARVVLAQPNLNLDAKVTVQKAYSDYIVDNNWASSAKLIVGDKVTVRQLLYGLMLPSGCDAAYALADKFGTGSTRAARVKSFIGKMNSTAKSLGLTNTHFDSFDGIGHGANYSTPRDLTKLASSAMKYSTFRTVVKTKSTKQKVTTKSGGYRYMDWTNTNPLLGTYSGAIGVKTGSGPEAKYCLVFAATRNSKTVIGTVLASSSVDNRTADAKKLLNYGFAK
ncbi:D-alanyl-D-alanine carboxypeptidase [Streptomyces bingchenggensis BCW-1]|uniref:D-alanyl-D-alanine carboxypeptidase n=1 Tax=Streptomyces bingchenggensis (strain BCW-1) TaxID=749414 RepID=D7C6S4_STRBB|nr:MULTISPECIES: D-alanyl-D-alanine carboxypeptidase [Streptomyces]ADI08311.1 D-alanyl-D-alanine carboxypeptidase [Streptomyces bingchenggensis BCW-1]